MNRLHRWIRPLALMASRRWDCEKRIRAAFPDAGDPEHWTCDLLAPHAGLHQHEERSSVHGGRMLWVWSSDGAYYSMIVHRHDANELDNT